MAAEEQRQAPGSYTIDTQTYVRFKFLLIGDSGVGKTNLRTRFVNDSFTQPFYTTIGVDFRVCFVVLDGETLWLEIGDTAGQERFRAPYGFYRAIHGGMLVYDVTSMESFRNIEHWLDKFNSYTSEDVPKILVGNRCDEMTQEVVEYNTAKEFADLHGIPFIETSAKDGTNVEQAFITLAAAAMNMKRPVLTDNSLKLNISTSTSSKKCC